MHVASLECHIHSKSWANPIFISSNFNHVNISSAESVCGAITACIVHASQSRSFSSLICAVSKLQNNAVTALRVGDDEISSRSPSHPSCADRHALKKQETVLILTKTDYCTSCRLIVVFSHYTLQHNLLILLRFVIREISM